MASGVLLALALPTVIPIVGKAEILPGGALTFLAYCGLAPFLYAVEGASPRGRFGLGVLAALTYYTVGIWWIFIAMHTFGGIPTALALPILYLLLGYLSVYWGLALVLDHDIRSRFPRLPQWIVLPVLFTALELCRNYLFSGFPWANVGYLLVRDRLEAQWASLFGVYGLAFIVILCNCALAALGRRFASSRGTAPADRARRGDGSPRAHAWAKRVDLPAAAALTIALVVPRLYGASRLREQPHGPALKVALIQGNVDQKIKNAAKGGQLGFQEYRDFVLNRYLPLSRQADAAGVDLIIWPEASFPGQLPLHPTLFPDVLGPPFRAQLLIGGVTLGRENDRTVLTNSAFALGPNREVVAEYDKHHLVPFGEYVPLEKSLHLPIHKIVPDIGFFDPGEHLNKIDVQGARGKASYGPLICFDAIFPEIGVEFGREDPDFLVNITNDAWYGFSSAAYQFLSMVALRAIETGKPIARAANTGISAFVSARGDILQSLPLGLVDTDEVEVAVDRAVAPQILIGEIPLTQGRTPYVVIGDAFAYLCALAGGLLWGLSKRKQPHAHRRPPRPAH